MKNYNHKKKIVSFEMCLLILIFVIIRLVTKNLELGVFIFECGFVVFLAKDLLF